MIQTDLKTWDSFPGNDEMDTVNTAHPKVLQLSE